MIGIAGKPLAPSDHVCITVPYGTCLDIGGIRARHLWLSHGETTPALTCQQRLEPLPPLLWGAELGQNFHIACVRRTTIKNFRGNWTPSHDLCERRIFQVSQPGPIRFVRQKEVPEASST